MSCHGLNTREKLALERFRVWECTIRRASKPIIKKCLSGVCHDGALAANISQRSKKVNRILSSQ